MKRKCLGVGIILLFVGASVTVTGNSVQKETYVMQKTNTIEHIPDNGLYWNDCKIAEYPVIFYLHYYFQRYARFYPDFIINGYTYMVDYYMNDLLQCTFEGPGPHYPFMYNITVTPFHHSVKVGIKAYFVDGEILWDNLTIYRLFP